jgi:hypothetical protein
LWFWCLPAPAARNLCSFGSKCSTSSVRSDILEHSDVAPLGLSGFSPAHFYKDTAPLALSEWLTTKSDGIRDFQD